MIRPFDRNDRGETLIEILMTVVILGLVFTAILGAMGMNLIASKTHRAQADATSVLVSAAERVASSDTTYVPCVGGNPGRAITSASNPYLNAAQSVSLPADTPAWTPQLVTIPNVTYETRSSTGLTSFASNCFNQAGLTLQLITLQVTSPNGRDIESLSVVKRNPCPVPPPVIAGCS